MRQTVSISSKAPSLVVIREAYERFFSSEVSAVTEFHEGQSFLTEEPRYMLVGAEDVGDWLKFQCLAAEWRGQRGAMSSITESALCVAYQRIIGMGYVAVPFILAELKAEGDEPDQWFWALKAITGEDPTREEDRGDFVAMGAAWLAWGNNRAYAW